VSLTATPAGVHLFLKGPSPVTPTSCAAVEVKYSPSTLGLGQEGSIVIDVELGDNCGCATFGASPAITLLIAGGAEWSPGQKADRKQAADRTHHSAKVPHTEDPAGRALTTPEKTFSLTQFGSTYSMEAYFLSTSWEPFVVQVVSVASGDASPTALDGPVAGVYATVKTELPESCVGISIDPVLPFASNVVGPNADVEFDVFVDTSRCVDGVFDNTTPVVILEALVGKIGLWGSRSVPHTKADHLQPDNSRVRPHGGAVKNTTRTSLGVTTITITAPINVTEGKAKATVSLKISRVSKSMLTNRSVLRTGDGQFPLNRRLLALWARNSFQVSCHVRESPSPVTHRLTWWPLVIKWM